MKQKSLKFNSIDLCILAVFCTKNDLFFGQGIVDCPSSIVLSPFPGVLPGVGRVFVPQEQIQINSSCSPRVVLTMKKYSMRSMKIIVPLISLTEAAFATSSPARRAVSQTEAASSRRSRSTPLGGGCFDDIAKHPRGTSRRMTRQHATLAPHCAWCSAGVPLT